MRPPDKKPEPHVYRDMTGQYVTVCTAMPGQSHADCWTAVMQNVIGPPSMTREQYEAEHARRELLWAERWPDEATI